MCILLTLLALRVEYKWRYGNETNDIITKAICDLNSNALHIAQVYSLNLIFLTVRTIDLCLPYRK